MDEYDITELMGKATMLALTTWLLTLAVNSEIKRWLYQAPLVTAIALMLWPLVPAHLIVSFIAELQILNLLTWRISPGVWYERRVEVAPPASIPGGVERRRRR